MRLARSGTHLRALCRAAYAGPPPGRRNMDDDSYATAPQPVTPAGATDSGAHHMLMGDWVANLRPYGSGPRWTPPILEIPPRHKCILLVPPRPQQYQRPGEPQRTLEVRKACGDTWLATFATAHSIDVLFLPGCGRRRPDVRAVDTPAGECRVFWSKPGGTTNEGVVAIVMPGVQLQVVSSIDPNELSLRCSPPVLKPNNPRQQAFAGVLEDAGLTVTDCVNPHIATYMGDGRTCYRIDLVVHGRPAERHDPICFSAWPPGAISDHAIVVLELGHPANRGAGPTQFRWRSVGYRVETAPARTEWALAARIMTRHHTAMDPVPVFDEMLTAAAHAALGQREKHVEHHKSAGLLQDPAALESADVGAARAIFKAIRSNAREALRNQRIRRADSRRQWEADCVPTDRG
eukprot:gene21206-54413_t